jgi:hypothetical protein
MAKPSLKIPALPVLDPDLDEDEEDVIKPIKKQAPAPDAGDKPKSGLLSFLPPPKSSAVSNPFLKNDTKTSTTTSLVPRQVASNSENTSKSASNPASSGSSLVPRVLTKQPPQPPAQSQKEKPPAPVEKKPAAAPKLPMLVGYGSDESDDDEESSDNTNTKPTESTETTSEILKNPFGPNADPDSDDYEQPDDYEQEPSHKRFRANEPPQAKTITFKNYNEDEYEEEEERQEYDVDDDPEPEFDDQFQKKIFDDEALKRFMGKRSKMDEIQFTDVSVNEIVGDNKAELMKQITSEYKPPSNKEYFTNSSRKSHQITYLAKVAKERDAELRQMWVRRILNHF